MNDGATARGLIRLLRLLSVILTTWVIGIVQRPSTLEERCAWRQRLCRRCLAALDIQLHVEGTVPQHGLLITNHISYIDVMVIGALAPAVFVSKAEVKQWPLIGGITARAGTIYLQRNSVRAAAEVNRAIAAALLTDVPVILFPEGTTTAGDKLLPFHPALFEPAVRAAAPIWPSAISYKFRSDGSDAAATVAFIGDDSVLPHILRLARRPPFSAQVRFSATPLDASTRTTAAAAGWEAVARLLLGRPEASAAKPVRTAQQATLA